MRYVTRAWVGDEVFDASHHLNDDADYGRSITVHTDFDDPVDTGLVDHRGVPLYRLRDTVRCGFRT